MLRNELIRIYAIVVLITFVHCNTALGYDDKITHPDLTNKAVEVSILDKYLKTNLALDNGINTKFPSDSKNTVIFLLKTGSTDEDKPNCRASSHFLNPRKEWSEAALSDTNETLLGSGIVNPVCFVLAPFDPLYGIQKYSNVTWATAYSSPTQGWTLTGNNADWNSVRSYYHLALTEQDKELRETYFANTFQSLGQVMHLIQDMAVPAHTRNDFIIKENLL